MTESVLQHALGLAERGISIFPCHGDKTPAVRNWKEDATTNEAQIRRWFSNASYLVAVCTGLNSKLFVLDVDPGAEDWLTANHERLDCERTHTTRRTNGRHFVYQYTSHMHGVTISAGKISKNIDTRGEGGYVIWWPAHGQASSGDLDDLSPPPQWLLDDLQTERPAVEPSDDGVVLPRGSRNNGLTRYAGSMRRAGLNTDQLIGGLKELNRTACQPALADAEVERIAKSIGSKSAGDPIRIVANGSADEARVAEAKRGWSMQNVRDYEVEDVDFIEDGVIPPGVTIYVGSPKIGKSQKVEHAACHISETKPVCYFAFEYNATSMAKRFQTYAHLPATYLRAWHQYDLLDSEQEPLEFIADRVQEHAPYLFVIDTVATVKRHTRGAYHEEYAAMQEIKRIADQASANAVLIHHSKKAGESEIDNPRELVLGSQALSGVPDNIVVLDRHDGCTRVRGWGRLIEDFETLFEFKDGDYQRVSEDQVFVETLKRQAPAEAKVLFALRDGPKTHTELVKATGLSGSHVADVKKSLKKKDLVSAPKESRGVWTYKGPTK